MEPDGDQLNIERCEQRKTNHSQHVIIAIVICEKKISYHG